MVEILMVNNFGLFSLPPMLAPVSRWECGTAAPSPGSVTRDLLETPSLSPPGTSIGWSGSGFRKVTKTAKNLSGQI